MSLGGRRHSQSDATATAMCHCHSRHSHCQPPAFHLPQPALEFMTWRYESTWAHLMIEPTRQQVGRRRAVGVRKEARKLTAVPMRVGLAGHLVREEQVYVVGEACARLSGKAGRTVGGGPPADERDHPWGSVEGRCARTRAGWRQCAALSVQAGRSGMSETVFGPWWLGAAGARLSVEVDEHVLALVQMGEIL